MTREEFNTKIIAQFKEFEEKEMEKSPAQIFNDAYEISKMTSLKDYLIDEMDDQIERCYIYADNILWALYEYEMDYDTPQWTEWDDISNMIDDFVCEHN